LVPSSLGAISDRFGTPSTSITLTGVVLLLLIAFVPIADIAKLASAFQILVFVLVNVAIVAFRRGTAEYEPEFHAPLYPWVQAVGVVGGLVLLTQMGIVPLLGAVCITAGGVAWYYVYARDRVDREGAAVDAVRRELGDRTLARTREAVTPTEHGYEALVAVPEDADPAHERALVDVAVDLAAPQHGTVTIVRFDEVPDQVPLEAATERSSGDLAFEERADTLAADLDTDVPIDVHEVVSHDTRRALANHVADAEIDTLVMAHQPAGLRRRVFDSDIEWVLAHTDCDAIVVEDGRGLGDVSVVTVLADERPYDPAKIAVADAIAAAHDATIRLEYAIEESASEEQRRTLADYHEEIAALCSVPVRTGFVRSDGGPLAVGADEEEGSDRGDGASAADADATTVLVVGTDGRSRAAADCPVLVVRPRGETSPGRFGRLLERRLL
jgi:nucleotide-binding universal stress UspA family protein